MRLIGDFDGCGDYVPGELNAERQRPQDSRNQVGGAAIIDDQRLAEILALGAAINGEAARRAAPMTIGDVVIPRFVEYAQEMCAGPTVTYVDGVLNFGSKSN